MYKLVEKYAFLPPNPPSYSHDEVSFLTRKDGGVIPFVFILDENASYTILYTHGNAEDLGQMLPLARLLREQLHVNVFVYDYGGYGLNGVIGECSESATYRDIRAVWEYLTDDLKIPSHRIILYGRSLGTGPTVHLASSLSNDYTHVGGVVLQSPISSAVAVVSNILCYLPLTNIFVNSSKIGKVKSPIFILHGTLDNVVPYDHGTLLRDCCKAKHVTFWSVVGAGHNNIEVHYGNELIRRLNEFIRSLVPIVQDKQKPSWSCCSSSL